MGVIDPRTAPPIGPGPEQDAILNAVGDAVSYTHLTLPTICSV